MKKITKQNWKKIVKDLKEKNAMVYTVSGKRKKAKNVNFKLHWNVNGNWEIIAYAK